MEPGFEGKIVGSEINSETELRRELRNARRVYQGKPALYDSLSPRPKSGYLIKQADADYLVTAPPPNTRTVTFKSTMDFWGDVTVLSANHIHVFNADPHSGRRNKPVDNTPKPRSTRTTGGYPIAGAPKQCSIRADMHTTRQK